MRLTIFGERPGPRTDPRLALYPHTTTGAAAHLIRLLGMTQDLYLSDTARLNVYHDSERDLSLTEARERVDRVMTETLVSEKEPRFLFVGKESLRAAPQFYRRMEFLEIKDLVMLLPHTSGVNRWYNSAENTEAARARLEEFLL